MNAFRQDYMHLLQTERPTLFQRVRRVVEHDAFVYAALVILMIVMALCLASSCKADGFTTTASAASTRNVSCYVKAYVSGDYTSDRMTMASVAVDSMGTSDVGLGGQVGCDIASWLWLAGLFADYTFRQGAIDATVSGISLLHVPVHNDGSIGARLGVLPTSRTLLYVLGAYTWSGSDSPTMVGVPLSLGGPHGIALGGGMEYALTTNISATLEYRHVAFDTQSTSIIPSSFTRVDDQVRFGIGYRF